MDKEKHDFFLHSNEVNHISKEDYDKIELLVNTAKAFARSTYQCVYIIDYFHQDFIYASDNLAYLCGLDPEQLMEAGYQMYIDHVPDADLQMLLEVNKKGFDFFNELPVDDRRCIHRIPDARQVACIHIFHRQRILFYAIDMKSIFLPMAFMKVMVQSTGGYQASHVCTTNQQFYWIVHL